MKIAKFLAAGAPLVLILCITASAETYYVDQSSTNSRGTQAEPFRTIQEAVNTVSPGDREAR